MTLAHTTLSTVPKLIANVLSLEAFDAARVFEAAGLDMTETLQSSERVDMESMYKLWDAASKATGNEGFGLLAASLFQPAYLKGIGLAWIASETLGEGLKRFINNIAMINTAVKIEIDEQPETFLIRYAPVDASSHIVRAHACAIQLGLGFLLRMFRLAASRPVPVSHVYVKHGLSEDLRLAYEAFFECSVEPEAEFNGIAFEKVVLSEALPASDPELAALNDQAIQRYMASMKRETTIKAVCDCVIPLLPSGCPSEQEVAVRLHMSRRTLQRKLNSEGTTYGALISETRNDLAKAYLSDSRMSVTEIAYQVGYGSPSSFSRAFKQINGMTPKDFKEAS